VNNEVSSNAPVHLILGASGGIGSAVCRRLAASGAIVALASRPSNRLDELARELEAPKWDLDVSDTTRVESVVSEASQAMHALGRLGEPSDVASLITWLLEPANSWVTGQVVGVDGGPGSLRTRD
jgi:NAD(P)-dependent dehydrogenase (short-subunit alcohol dehydrogenase family)